MGVKFGVGINGYREQVQADTARRILRCSSMTSRDAMYGDLGWWSLRGRRNLKKLIYWYKLETLENSRLLKKVYLVTAANQKTTSAAMIMKGLLVQYELGHLWDNKQSMFNLDGQGNLAATCLSDHMAFWKKIIKSRIHQFEEKTWWDRVTKDYEQKKTRTYIKQAVLRST